MDKFLCIDFYIGNSLRTVYVKKNDGDYSQINDGFIDNLALEILDTYFFEFIEVQMLSICRDKVHWNWEICSADEIPTDGAVRMWYIS